MIAFTTLVSRVLRARKVGAVAMGFGLGATVILALSTHRLYRSEAVMVYEHGAQAVGATEGTSARGLASRVGDMMLSRERLEGARQGDEPLSGDRRPARRRRRR